MERNLILRVSRNEREDILNALRNWRDKTTSKLSEVGIGEIIEIIDNAGEDDCCPFMGRERVSIGENSYRPVPWCNHQPSQRAKP